MKQNNGLVKDRLIEVIVSGELGSVVDQGIVFTRKEFKSVFHDIKPITLILFCPPLPSNRGGKL